MRRIMIAATGFLFAAAFLPAASLAGNVLLPSSAGDNSYLGLGAPAAASDSSAATPPAAPAPPPQSLPDVTPAASVSAPTVQTPAAAASTPVSEPIISPIDAASAAKLPPGTIPTQVIQQPDVSAALAQAGKNLPYGLTLAIGGQSIFGAKDVEAITDKLGLSRDQIPGACILTLGGIMQTDKGSYILNGGASPQVSVRYDGVIQNYLMNATALCKATHLPPGSGFLTETNGRFSVALQQINCPAPTRQAAKLTITYNGGDSAQCVYE